MEDACWCSRCVGIATHTAFSGTVPCPRVPLQATEQKLDIAKKRLYFPAVKGFG